MQLRSFSVSGFRSLHDIDDLPLRTPTILTGRNDSGKSATLDALAFLLNARRATESDFLDGMETAVSEQLSVTGEFVLSAEEHQALGLPETVRIRRIAVRGSARADYQVERQVPVDVRLRDLDFMNLPTLKETARALKVSPDGAANAKESFLRALRPLAAACEQCLDWVQASDETVGDLPKYLHLSGADVTDTRAQLRTALKFTYQGILRDDKFIKLVDELQASTEAELAGKADELCELIERRCDGFSEVSIKPQVSFRDALSDVQVVARRDGRSVDFDEVGAGRRRQLVQAIWEWSNDQLRSTIGQGTSVVVAYDEPDTHLDYVRQRGFMELVRSQCTNPGVRSIVATHSVQMIDQIPLEDVVHLELKDGLTVVHKLPDTDTSDDCESFISQLAEELGLTTSTVLFERCFLLVEGESEKSAFPRLFRLATGRRTQEVGVILFDSGGNGTVLKLIAHLRAMGKPVLVIVDKDSLKQSLFKRENLEKHGVRPEHIDYIGDPNELEELFTDEQWTITADKFWPRSDGQLWRPAQVAGLRGTGKFSNKLVDLLERGSDQIVRKPKLVARLAELLQSRDEIPDDLIKAFERVLDYVQPTPPGQHVDR
jgi:putative ATP-dependent endonuclease of OLD family